MTKELTHEYHRGTEVVSFIFLIQYITKINVKVALKLQMKIDH